MSFKAINPIGDPYVPNLRLTEVGETIQGTATDSEDINANGILDAGEDLNGNGKIDRRSEDTDNNGKLDNGEDANANSILDRDTGIFRAELLPDAVNLKLEVLPFVPGALAVQFSITRIDPTKPGTGTLHVEDGAGNKKETPVAIGAASVLQNVRVIETLSTSDIEIDVASFAKPPFSIIDGVNQKIIEWRFDTFKADSTADLGFDVILKKPIPGEKRLVSYKLDLYYNDVNGQPVHTGLGEHFVNVHASSFIVTPTTSKAIYNGNELVEIASVIKNLSAYAGSVSVRLSITDTKNVLVSTLGTLSSQNIGSGGTANFNGLNFATGNTYVGEYKVVAELVDSNGVVLAMGYAPFVIVTANGPSVKAAITTDKQLYQPSETVKVNSRITNLSGNTLLNDLRVVTKVINPDGSMRFASGETLPQLGVGILKDYSYSVPLGFAPPGQYTANLTVTSASGTPLAQASTQFAVASSTESGSGLAGSILATPKQVPQGEAVAFAFNASNSGNSMFTDLPLKISIIDPAAQKIMAEFPTVQTLAIGTPYNGGVSWTTSGDVGTTYVAVLTATVASKTLTLAQENFTLIAPPIKLDITQTLTTGNRVLALISCKDGENEADQDGTPAACISQRSQTIGEALTALGVMHTIVTNEVAFKQELRSGLYNTYWISGKQDKLHDDLAAEVREAVFGGDGLLLDSEHDQRNKTLDAITGITWRGKIGQTELPVDITGPVFAPQRLDTVGRALKLELNGGRQQAAFNGGKPNSDGPAIISNNYGAGRSVLYAFDLPASLQAQASWQPVLEASLQHVMPAQPAMLTPGAHLPVKTRVTNLAQAIGITIDSTLPAGARYLGSHPAATYDAALAAVNWAFTLAEEQTRDVFLTFQAPSTAGTVVLRTIVSTVKAGSVTPYGDPLALPITVTAAAQTGADAVSALNAFALAQNKDRKLRDSLVAQLQSAMAHFNQGTQSGYESAIGQLIAIVDQLSGLTAIDTRAVHDGVDRILKEAQWRWTQAAAVQ